MTIYLSAPYKLTNVIRPAVYSSLKSQLIAFYRCHFVFLHSLLFHQLSAHRLNNGNNLILERGILLPVPC